MLVGSSDACQKFDVLLNVLCISQPDSLYLLKLTCGLFVGSSDNHLKLSITTTFGRSGIYTPTAPLFIAADLTHGKHFLEHSLLFSISSLC